MKPWPIYDNHGIVSENVKPNNFIYKCFKMTIIPNDHLYQLEIMSTNIQINVYNLTKQSSLFTDKKTPENRPFNPL